MANEASVDTDFLSDLAARFDGITGKGFPRIDRAGLRAVNKVVKEVLTVATPIALRVPTPGSTALKPGELRASLRSRIVEDKSGAGLTAITDFGKNNYVAHFVDGGTSHSTAYPFVRETQDRLEGAATADVYTLAAEAEVEKVLNGL